jgi:hypothetical protein
LSPPSSIGPPPRAPILCRADTREPAILATLESVIAQLKTDW